MRQWATDNESLINIFGQFIAAIALIVTIWSFNIQLIANKELEKSKFLTDYTTEFITTDELHKTLVDIEYEKFDYCRLVQESVEEDKLSRLLDFLNIIAYNTEAKRNYIPLTELKQSTLGYAIFVVTTTPEIQRYMQAIDKRSLKRHHISEGTAWGYLRRVGPRLVKMMASQRSIAPVKIKKCTSATKSKPTAVDKKGQ